MSKIHLPDVTLIAMTGLGYKTPEHVEALKKSCEGIEWGAVKLIQLGEIVDIDSWNKAMIYELWKYVDTSHAMIIHEDGHVINPQLWNPDWLKYDYIGAPWPLPQDDYSYRTPEGELVRVGNSVSLRSRALMVTPFKCQYEWKSYYGNTNEDGFLTVHNRDRLMADGFKFAPLEVAVHFSKEHEIPENQDITTFAFHSL